MTSPHWTVAWTGGSHAVEAPEANAVHHDLLSREKSRLPVEDLAPGAAVGEPNGDAGTQADPQPPLECSVRYDYLLVVGPGRSGSDFLYENLKLHPRFSSPEIKEGSYYRSMSRYRKARANSAGSILADISNRAWCDPMLREGVERIARDGDRALLVVLLRRHRDRAASAVRFRRSRGYLSALASMRHLKKSVIADSLTADDLSFVFSTAADLMAIDFEALTADPREILSEMSKICGVAEPVKVIDTKVNQSMKARFVPLSALGLAVARLIRRLRLLKLLQRLKNSALIDRALRRPSDEHDERIEFSEEELRTLDRLWAECSACVEDHTFRFADGIRFRHRQS